MQRIDLDIRGAAYPIFVGHDILGELGPCCRDLALGRQVALVSDEVVAAHYLQPAATSLRAAGFEVLEIVYAGGEEAKNLHGAEEIFTQMIAAGFDRGAWVVALGGGRSRRHGGLCGLYLFARRALCAGADDHRRAGGFEHRRQDRVSITRWAKT